MLLPTAIVPPMALFWTVNTVRLRLPSLTGSCPRALATWRLRILLVKTPMRGNEMCFRSVLGSEAWVWTSASSRTAPRRRRASPSALFLWPFDGSRPEKEAEPERRKSKALEAPLEVPETAPAQPEEVKNTKSALGLRPRDFPGEASSRRICRRKRRRPFRRGTKDRR